jgi:UDP-4-amino-4,6-dideoxy-N-acetyl-beta-L-altrosamine N-acetyltransferase
MGFTLREIRENDLENIMRWRMDADITRYMNTNPKLTLEGQKKWFEAISADSDVFYRMIEVDGVPSGVINLTKLNAEDGNIGWAYYVGEKKQRSMKLALALEMNMYDYVFDTLRKNAVYSDVFTLNQGVIALHKLCGCEVVEEKKAHVCKEGIYYDVTFMRMTADNWKNIRPSKKYEKITFI